MASAIGPGDWVECVNARPQAVISTGLRTGAIYLIEALTPPREGLVAGFLLVGHRHPGNPLGDYDPRRFRPVYRPNASIIQALKQPLPDLVDA